MLDKKGTGLVEMIQRKYLADKPGTPLEQLPCGWRQATDDCKNPTCPRCEFGAKLNKTQAKFLVAGCTPDLIKRIPKESPLAKLIG